MDPVVAWVVVAVVVVLPLVAVVLAGLSLWRRVRELGRAGAAAAARVAAAGGAPQPARTPGRVHRADA